jgi:hypothetical protein
MTRNLPVRKPQTRTPAQKAKRKAKTERGKKRRHEMRLGEEATGAHLHGFGVAYSDEEDQHLTDAVSCHTTGRATNWEGIEQDFNSAPPAGATYCTARGLKQHFFNMTVTEGKSWSCHSRGITTLSPFSPTYRSRL